jgi:hypothetical protein
MNSSADLTRLFKLLQKLILSHRAIHLRTGCVVYRTNSYSFSLYKPLLLVVWFTALTDICQAS